MNIIGSLRTKPNFHDGIVLTARNVTRPRPKYTRTAEFERSAEFRSRFASDPIQLTVPVCDESNCHRKSSP